MIKDVNHLSLALISKTNTVVFYLFYGIMGIERDSWHPGQENGSLLYFMFERSLPSHWMAFFNCYFLESAMMATTKAAKLMMTIKA